RFLNQLLNTLCLVSRHLFSLKQEGDKTMGNMGAVEWVLIILAVVLLFGAKKIPELAKGLGQGIREFKKASREIQNGVEDEVKKIDETVKKG
ncbi:MAG: twin-arginine translocase TatA/TatE family subunit, partial [Bacteroidota bacterium]